MAKQIITIYIMNNLTSVSIERVNTATIIRKGINSILFSYDTIVAIRLDGKVFQTNKKYSATTSKQVNSYVGNDISIGNTPNELIELSGKF